MNSALLENHNLEDHKREFQRRVAEGQAGMK